MAKKVFVYIAMLAAAVGVFFVVQSLGNTLVAPPPSAAPQGAVTRNAHALLHVLLALVAIIACGRGLGFLFAKIKQPRVMGEVIAGILLGPSLLGKIAPSLLLPASVAPSLGAIAQLGVILYMFCVGLSLDVRALRGKAHTTVAISHASIVLPFALGTVLALVLYPRTATSDVPFSIFALFVGVSMSVTAFPVLARILTDRGIDRTRMGVLALSCAAADDVTAWCLLAFVVSLASGVPADALVTIGLTLAYGAFMVFVVAPRLEKAKLLPAHIPMVLLGVLGSALVTEAIGIHAIFGAFLFGAIIPSDSELASTLRHKLEDVVAVVFLPAFFAFTGMRTEIGLVEGVGQWLLVALIIGVASVGKFAGTAIAAKLTGETWRDASAFGVLMNTRGLMELIVLNIGLDLGILSSTLFAMLLIMAVVTTLATGPLLALINARSE